MENKQVKVREKIGSVVKCKNCGAEFTKQFGNEQYCSAECKLEMTRYHWRKRSLKYKAKKKLEKQQLEQLAQQQVEQQMAQQVNDTNTDDTTVDVADSVEMEANGNNDTK